MSERGPERSEHDPTVAVSRALEIGLVTALVIMGSAMIAALIHTTHTGHTVFDRATTLSRLPGGLLRGDIGAVLSLGILVLIATPVVRVMVLLVSFARLRRWLFVWVSLAVLGILAVSVFAGPV